MKIRTNSKNLNIDKLSNTNNIFYNANNTLYTMNNSFVAFNLFRVDVRFYDENNNLLWNEETGQNYASLVTFDKPNGNAIIKYMTTNGENIHKEMTGVSYVTLKGTQTWSKWGYFN